MHIIKSMKRPATELKERFAVPLHAKVCLSRTHKELTQVSNKRRMPIKMDKDLDLFQKHTHKEPISKQQKLLSIFSHQDRAY